jgi:hypothetical protein
MRSRDSKDAARSSHTDIHSARAPSDIYNRAVSDLWTGDRTRVSACFDSVTARLRFATSSSEPNRSA